MARARALAEVERDPLEVRAVVLRAGDKSLALVLIDLVLIPDDLTQALEARLADLALNGLVLAATHTHSSVGGFDRRILAQFAGTGRYRDDVVAVLLAGPRTRCVKPRVVWSRSACAPASGP